MIDRRGFFRLAAGAFAIGVANPPLLSAAVPKRKFQPRFSYKIEWKEPVFVKDGDSYHGTFGCTITLVPILPPEHIVVDFTIIDPSL